MKSFYKEEFEDGDKVRLITDWYQKAGFPFKKGDIFTVKYQDGEDVQTDKGIFDFDELELVNE
ncbi:MULTISPECIES: hypothetical protein [Clostridium]|jgi:hypothetical protein|uniref:hypothetical protein n=1 Tax=Clostridium TaxID=1485 RepID=UPI000E98DF99|nr:hypothetical protein [Clostridium tyrobutyricum]HBF77167.1 hypothetical protein [Clostridiaceae bacterium]